MKLTRTGIAVLLSLATLMFGKKPKAPTYHQCVAEICIDDLKILNEYSGIFIIQSKVRGILRNNTNNKMRDAIVKLTFFAQQNVLGDGMAITSFVPQMGSWEFVANAPLSSVPSSVMPTSFRYVDQNGVTHEGSIAMTKACNHALRAKYC